MSSNQSISILNNQGYIIRVYGIANLINIGKIWNNSDKHCNIQLQVEGGIILFHTHKIDIKKYTQHIHFSVGKHLIQP